MAQQPASLSHYRNQRQKQKPEPVYAHSLPLPLPVSAHVSTLLAPDSIIILPEEEWAIQHYYVAGKLLAALNHWDHPLQAQHYQELTSSIHLIQTGLGSLRFWHSFNEPMAHKMTAASGKPIPVMTSPETLVELTTWGHDFEQYWQSANLPIACQQAMAALMVSWTVTLQLTERFPNQHVYEEIQRGLIQSLEAMKAIVAAGFEPPVSLVCG